MRFSEIKNNPLDYDKQIVLDKLKEHFTIGTLLIIVLTII